MNEICKEKKISVSFCLLKTGTCPLLNWNKISSFQNCPSGHRCSQDDLDPREITGIMDGSNSYYPQAVCFSFDFLTQPFQHPIFSMGIVYVYAKSYNLSWNSPPKIRCSSFGAQIQSQYLYICHHLLSCGTCLF